MKKFAFMISLLLVLAVALSACGTNNPSDNTSAAGGSVPDDTVFRQASYTVSDEKAESAADTVVATMGEIKLTNADLQAYYWNEVYDFLNSYDGTLSDIGLDYTLPLDEQECLLREGYTWQQYFLENALSTWQRQQALTMMAKEAGFKLNQELQTSLDNIETQLEEAAAYYKYESAIAFLKLQMGAGITVAAYKNYLEAYYTASGYYEECYNAIPSLSDAELEAYYEANKAELDPNNTGKDTSPVFVDVRHILVLVETIAGEEPEGGYTEEQWLAVEAAAEEILKQWQENPTEEYFISLANEKSEDGGSNTKGGLYEGVTPSTSFVQEFLDWCFAEGRQVGDTGLVKSVYGYHVMYLSSRGEHAWISNARSHYEAAKVNEIMANIEKNYPITVDYGKVVLGQVDLSV